MRPLLVLDILDAHCTTKNYDNSTLVHYLPLSKLEIVHRPRSTTATENELSSASIYDHGILREPYM